MKNTTKVRTIKNVNAKTLESLIEELQGIKEDFSVHNFPSELIKISSHSDYLYVKCSRPATEAEIQASIENSRQEKLKSLKSLVNKEYLVVISDKEKAISKYEEMIKHTLYLDQTVKLANMNKRLEEYKIQLQSLIAKLPMLETATLAEVGMELQRQRDFYH